MNRSFLPFRCPSVMLCQSGGRVLWAVGRLSGHWRLGLVGCCNHALETSLFWWIMFLSRCPPDMQTSRPSPAFFIIMTPWMIASLFYTGKHPSYSAAGIEESRCFFSATVSLTRPPELDRYGTPGGNAAPAIHLNSLIFHPENIGSRRNDRHNWAST